MKDPQDVMFRICRTNPEISLEEALRLYRAKILNNEQLYLACIDITGIDFFNAWQSLLRGSQSPIMDLILEAVLPPTRG